MTTIRDSNPYLPATMPGRYPKPLFINGYANGGTSEFALLLGERSSPSRLTLSVVRTGFEPAPLTDKLACLRLPTLRNVLFCGVLYSRVYQFRHLTIVLLI